MDETAFILGLMLAAKHFIADGPLQTPYQYLNKGKFGHFGGIMHAAIHGFLSFPAIILAGAPWWLAVADAVAHYVIDFVKTRYSKREWAERTDAGLLIKSDWYFYALVLDQSAHFATYAVIIAVASGV